MLEPAEETLGYAEGPVVPNGIVLVVCGWPIEYGELSGLWWTRTDAWCIISDDMTAELSCNKEKIGQYVYY